MDFGIGSIVALVVGVIVVVLVLRLIFARSLRSSRRTREWCSGSGSFCASRSPA